MKEKIVLAFSGGLDTSYCLFDLVNKGYEVHTVFINSGGIDEQETTAIALRAESLGAYKHRTIEAGDMIWQEFVLPLIYAKAKMRNQYPLLCSDRYVIVKLCLDLCEELNTKHFAHGCTAMGNDQFRFDQTVHSLGDFQIHAPIRDLQDQVKGNVRDHEIKMLNQAGFSSPLKHQKYSINENMLGVTISGGEIDEFKAPSFDTYHWVKPRINWPSESLELKVAFKQGVPVSINGKAMKGVDILSYLNKTLGEYGVGRHIYTGDVSIGIKGRIVFECPGIDALYTAHQALEDVVNSKLQNQFRQTIADRWADLIYQGFYYEPHKYDLECYLKNSQSHVTGIVNLSTEGGQLLATSISSEFIVQDPQSTYAQSSDWSANEAIGFIRLSGQASSMVNKVRRKAFKKAGRKS